jgi:hypothetical protein
LGNSGLTNGAVGVDPMNLEKFALYSVITVNSRRYRAVARLPSDRCRSPVCTNRSAERSPGNRGNREIKGRDRRTSAAPKRALLGDLASLATRPACISRISRSVFQRCGNHPSHTDGWLPTEDSNSVCKFPRFSEIAVRILNAAMKWPSRVSAAIKEFSPEIGPAMAETRPGKLPISLEKMLSQVSRYRDLCTSAGIVGEFPAEKNGGIEPPDDGWGTRIRTLGRP